MAASDADLVPRAAMNGFIYTVDRISLMTGRAFSWCIVVLTLGVCYEVFVRYVLRAPTGWSFDLSYMMYGALFFMSGAYTLARGGHVRGDILYRRWSERAQARLDLALYILFFFPGMAALIIGGTAQAAQSWRFGEVSVFSPNNIPVSPLKTLVPVGAALLTLQGVAEVCRCIQCIRSGAWPPRLHDVEELEAQILAQHAAKADARGEGAA
jgi:TRAP-type mannitol/chloroaromatic compound transport system permease small subunit